ncbi:MAG: acetyl-CoA hydrolase/transferase family protein [Acidobacteria bacterium]|nr:acetyl-CoA hydrolase/transferase family protein [Acidobacteriota bacterium]MBI3486849.1 acetyl-CoA hydrolase/transferase family protein [Acidobacteriota bacterium]
MSIPFPVMTAAEAAELIGHGQTIGFSGFTAAGAAKDVPAALAEKAKREHAAGRPFKVGVLTGASTGASLDGALAEAEAISFRAPYQSNATLRKQINSGQVRFVDMHLSVVPQNARYGFLGPIHFAVVEACDITAGGGIVLSTSVGASNTYLRLADKIIIELNESLPPSMLGMHDLFEPQDPPTRAEIPVFNVSDRIGSPICTVDPRKIVAVVRTNRPDETGAFDQATEVTDQIGQHVARFLVAEMKAGRIPSSFLPLQSGVGNIANAVLAALGENKDIPPFEMYTEVVQDSVVPLLENGRCTFASTCALTLSLEARAKILGNLDYFKQRVLLRPQEISNHPEIVRRIGIVSMNTAIEVDLGGNVNSTHVMGSTMMNGIGGSGDFTRNAYLSIFSCPSTAKGGMISAIVPMVSHVDHSEHSVQIVVTEQGVADLRGKDPHERAELIIDHCAHPAYREQLRDYLKLTSKGHAPLALDLSFAMHREFLASGDMRKTNWGAYR